MSEMRDIADAIAGSPAFAGLAAAQVDALARCGRDEGAAAGAYLLRERLPAECFYLIRSGSVALETDVPGRGPLIIETLHAGELLGWSWLFSPYRWQFDARAVYPCSLVAFDAASVRAQCEADHELGYELMLRFAHCIAERLQATRLQLLDVYGSHRAAG